MKTDIKVSVIVPVYNVEKYLEQCVRSIINQTYENIEIILVDDGSRDSSGKICDQIADANEKIRVFHKENGGLVSAWKKGLFESTAEWVVFVDSDDWIEPEHIEMLVREQEKENADVVVIKMKQICGSQSTYIEFAASLGNYSGKKLQERLYPIMLNAGGFEKRGIPVSRASKLIRKELLMSNLKFCKDTTTFEEDLNIIFPVLMDAKSISLLECENAAYCYRRVEESMLHGYDKNMKSSIEHVYPAIRQACKEKNKEFFLSQIEAEYLSAMIRCFTNELQNPKGFAKTKENIKNFCTDHTLQEVIKKVNWMSYPLKFRVVINAMKNFNWFNSNIVTRFLHIVKNLS